MPKLLICARTGLLQVNQAAIAGRRTKTCVYMLLQVRIRMGRAHSVWALVYKCAAPRSTRTPENAWQHTQQRQAT